MAIEADLRDRALIGAMMSVARRVTVIIDYIGIQYRPRAVSQCLGVSRIFNLWIAPWRAKKYRSSGVTHF